MRWTPLVMTAALGLSAACAPLPSWVPLAAWAPFAGTCPVPSGATSQVTVVGGQVRVPISLLQPGSTDAREVAAPNADVCLADAQGLPLPGIHAKSNADGTYAISPALPNTAVEVDASVQASSRGVTLRGLAMPGANGGTADVNIATTILTVALTDGMTGMPGNFDLAQYQRAVTLVYQHLVVEGSPDPTDTSAILAKLVAWEGVDPELKSLVEALKQELRSNPPQEQDVIGKLDGAAHQAPPGTSPVPTHAVPRASSTVPATVASTPTPTPSPVPSGIAPTSAFPPGFADGPLVSARFNGLGGLAVAADGTVYVADVNNHRIRKVDFSDAGNPVVSTLAGNDTDGYADGPASAALFSDPRDLAIDAQGKLYVLEYNGARLRVVDLNADAQPVSTLAGGAPGHNDGPGATARFDHPSAIAIDPVLDRAYVVESAGSIVRAVDLSGADHAVTTFAGRYNQPGYRDGAPTDALFDAPEGVAVGPDHTVYVADTISGVIRRIQVDASGQATTVDTLAGQYTQNTGAAETRFQDGDAHNAQFQGPVGLSIDTNGDLLVADSGNHRVRRIKLSDGSNTVSTAFGPVAQDWQGRTIQLAYPYHTAGDGKSGDFVTDLRLGLLLKVPAQNPAPAPSVAVLGPS